MGDDSLDNSPKESFPKHILPQTNQELISQSRSSLHIVRHSEPQATLNFADRNSLLSIFLFLGGLAWGIAYADGFTRTLQVALIFVVGHFLGVSLLLSIMMYFLVGRVLGKRKQGLFGPPVGGGEDALEFGYCFDVRDSLSETLPAQADKPRRSQRERSYPCGCFCTSCSFY